jgi:hypothetical protein
VFRLGITKIDRFISMSNMKYDAVTESGIRIVERVDIPEVRRTRPPRLSDPRARRDSRARRAAHRARALNHPSHLSRPQELIPCDAHVEIDAKVFAGYFAGAQKVKTFEELQGTVGRGL